MEPLYETVAKLPPLDSELYIPKILHTIWFNFGKGTEIFPQYKENIQSFLDFHPGWEHKHWDEESVTNLIREKYPDFLITYLSYHKPVKKHDAARIVILDAFGGLYLDHDFYTVKNLEPLLRSYKFVVGNQTDSKFSPANGLIASIPKSPVLKSILNEMSKPEVAESLILEATGVKLFKTVLQNYISNNDSSDIKVYSQVFFYPLLHIEKQKFSELTRENIPIVFSDSYLVHSYDSNWYDQE